MLSPDPVTQAPENGQNYNRYSHAFNNPLRYADPTGYCASNELGGCSSATSELPPANPFGSYGPSVFSAISWIQTLRLEDLTEVLTNAGVSESEITSSPYIQWQYGDGKQELGDDLQSDGTVSGLTEVFENKEFRRILDFAIGRTTSAVRGEKALSGDNYTLGVVVRQESESEFTIGNNVEAGPSVLVPRGFEAGTGFGGNPVEIRGEAAVVISLPTYARNARITGNTDYYNSLSTTLDSPLVVTSPSADVWVFNGSGDPIPYVPGS